MSKRLPVLILCVFLVGGCSKRNPEATAGQDVRDLISGEWVTAMGVAYGVQIHYVISWNPQQQIGSIVVTSDGDGVARHEFDIADVNAIQIKNATAGSFKGETMLGEGWKELFELRNPPRVLHFTRTPGGGSSGVVSKYRMYMHGLFDVDSQSVPIPLFRVVEDSEAMNIPPSELLHVPIMGRWTIKGMPPDYFYVFSETDGHGVLMAGTKDATVTVHDFYAVGPCTIRIKEGKGKGAVGEWFTAMDMARLVLLIRPPETLRFSGEGAVLQMHGVFASIPITLIRSR